LAAGGQAVEVVISSLDADSSGYTLRGNVSNAGSVAAPVQRLTFEFLDANGNVQVAQSVEIPGLPPQGSRDIEVRVPGTALVAWRYRPS